MSEVEIIADSGLRRRRRSAETLRIVEAALDESERTSAVARRDGVAPDFLYRWRKPMRDGGIVAVTGDAAVARDRTVRRLEDRIRALERQLGRRTMEAGIPRGAAEKSRSRKPGLLAGSLKTGGARRRPRRTRSGSRARPFATG